MLVKKFVPKALMQQNQQLTLIDSTLEVVEQIGYFLLNPGFCSPVAGVSSEQVFWRNFLFYNKEKMELKERMVADKLTVAVQEALIRGCVYDVRGFGSKIQYSKLYGCSFSWCDIPEVKVKYKTIDDKYFDYSSYLKIYPTSSQLTKLDSHDYYLKELNQAIKSVKDCDLLTPKLNNKGFLVYPLVDNTFSDRLKFNTIIELTTILKPFSRFEIPLTSSIAYNPAKYPNILLAGEIGGGKTYTCVSLACEMALKGYEINVIDGKDADLAYFGSTFLPSNRTATTGESALKLLRSYVKDMDDRYLKMKTIRSKTPKGHILTDFRSFNLKPKMLFVDEFASILSQLSSKQAKEATSLLKQLVLKNRQAGCFVCISTQQPNAKILDTDVRDNLMLRIFMGRPKTEVKTMVFGSGVELPELSADQGVGYVQFAGSDVVQIFHSATLPSDRMQLYKLVKDCMKMQCTS